MNAVNLIPSDCRKQRTTVSASPATLALIGGLVVVLAAAVLYVFAVNDVRARKSELARVTASAASWQAAANSYTSYMTAAQQRTQQIADIRQLVAGRFPWYALLSQIGGVMPADAALSALQATPPSANATTATASAGASPSSTASTSGSAVSLSGCAASQSAVAATMVALRQVRGVGSVSLASSARGTAGAGSGSAASSGSSGSGTGSTACPFPVTFQMSLVLASPATTPATTTSAATPAATSGTTPAASPTASVSTPSSGAAR